MPLAPVPLTVDVRTDGDGRTVVRVGGEVDLFSAPQLRDRLFEIAATGTPVRVDLDAVGFIDATGVATLLGARRRFERAGVPFEIGPCSDAVRWVLDLCHEHGDALGDLAC